MKLNDFRGDLTNKLAKTITLPQIDPQDRPMNLTSSE